MTTGLVISDRFRTDSSLLAGRSADRRAIAGASGALRAVIDRVDKVAPTRATVLLQGETGTGKELIARAIHERSGRRPNAFVVVDCGALPASLIESELFGRERGAFTGADTSRAGRFELAHGGTIFLDEIGELPIELQPKLLRVLQEGEVERLGSMRVTRVDVRVIAATNRDLAEDVARGRFRRDLFYRLNVFPITLPPLRERRADLPVLASHLAERLGRQLGRPFKEITPRSLQVLARHDWPGNVRELENVLQQAIILSPDGTIDLGHIAGLADEPGASAHVTGGTHSRERSETAVECFAEHGPDRRIRALVEAERDHLHFVLEHAGWRIEGPGGAAQLLGLPSSTLRGKMRRLGVRRASWCRSGPPLHAFAHETEPTSPSSPAQ